MGIFDKFKSGFKKSASAFTSGLRDIVIKKEIDDKTLDNIEDYDLKRIGPEIENHNYFPEKCNVTLAKVISKELIKVKVWERGAGLTKACGTAACATAVAANINGLIDKKTDIEFTLGKLSISIDENNSVHMKGPVSDIINIEISI